MKTLMDVTALPPVLFLKIYIYQKTKQKHSLKKERRK